jgi:hypothetical protein
MPCKDPEAEKAYQKAYRAANKERMSAVQKAWNEANKARKAAVNKAWRATNKEKVATGKKGWAQANKERKAASNKAWAQTNPAKVSASNRAWNLANRPEQYHKAYDPNNPYGPKQLLDGEWVRLERSACTFLPAPDTSLAAHLAAALIVIDERLAFPV